MNIRWPHCVLKVRDIDALIDRRCEAFGFSVANRGGPGPSGE